MSASRINSNSSFSGAYLGATKPLLSTMGIIAGGYAAVLLVPGDNWVVPGALRLSGIAMAMGLMFGVVLAAMRAPIALFRAELIIMFGLVYWLVLDAIQASYFLEVGRGTVEQLFAAVALFAASLWVGSGLTSAYRPIRVSKPVTTALGAGFLFWAALACALMGVSFKTLTCQIDFGCLYESVTLPRFGIITNYELDYRFSPLKRLRPVGLLALPLAVAYFMAARKFSWRGFLLLMLVVLNLLLLLSDGRRQIGTTAGAGILMFVLLQRQVKVRHLLALLGATAVLLLVLETMLAWRNVGIDQAVKQELSISYRPGVIAVDKNLYHATRAMALVPALHPHTEFTGVAAKLGKVIPRRFFDQPYQFGFDYISASGLPRPRHWSATFSIIGDLWIIGGFTALVIGGFLYGILANLVSRMLLQNLSIYSRLLYSISVMALFLSLRALHELTTIGLAVFALWGMFKLKQTWERRQGSGEMPVRPYQAN